MGEREQRPVKSVWIGVGSKSLLKLKGEVISAPKKRAGVGQLRASGYSWGQRAVQEARE
jgi:hypothetical protein